MQKAGIPLKLKTEENGNKKVKIAHICENYMGHYIFFTPSYYEKRMVRIRNITVFSLQDKKEIRRKTTTRLVKTF